MPTSTTNYGLSKPLVNNATDQDLWGGYINTDLDSLDSLLLTAFNFTPTAASGTITVTAPTSGSTTTGSAKLLYLCNASGGAFNANLPAAATASGMTVAFKKTDSSTNAITVKGNAAELIDAANTFIIGSQYNYLILVCNGTGWNIVSQTAASVSNATSSSTGVVQPDNVSINVNGSGVISARMTPLGIGSIILATNLTGGNVAAGATTTASNLTISQFSSTSVLKGTGDALTGTWMALQSLTPNGANGGTGLWQRTA